MGRGDYKQPKRFWGRKKKNPNPNSQVTNQGLSPQTEANYSAEEVRIYDLAEQAYLNAIQSYHNPSLPDPLFLFDYSKQTGFFINNITWQITLNLANTPNIHLDNEYHDYFYALSMHEIGHYDYCPYDGLTNLRLLAAANKGGVNKYIAPIVVNIFADLLIDTRLFERHPDLMVWELRKDSEETLSQLKGQPPSQMWKVISRCYEILWNQNGITPVDFSDIEKPCQAICKILQKDQELVTTWANKVEKIAKILKDIFKDECKYDLNFGVPSQGTPTNPDQNQGNTPPQGTQEQKDDENGNQQNDKENNSENEGEEEKDRPFLSPHELNDNGSSSSGTNPIQIPDDVKQTFGNLTEIKNIDLLKSEGTGNQSSQGPNRNQVIENLAEQLAITTNYRDFANTMNILGLNESQEIIATWYRGKAKNLLEIQIFTKKQGGSLPSYPSTWRIGDPIEELDVLQSILVSPVVIPNITTRKWNYKDGPGRLTQKGLPDLMVVLDSSGSMGWDFNQNSISGRFHVALLAAFAAIHFALQRGSFVAGINFSSSVKIQPWTNDPKKIERLLLTYQSSGTILPMNHILGLVKAATRKSIVILISDLEIDNWGTAIQGFFDIMQAGNKLIAFFIDGHPLMLESPDFVQMRDMGAKFYCIDKIEDLTGLVIKEVKEGFGEAE